MIGNYRRIFNVKKIDICDLTSTNASRKNEVFEGCMNYMKTNSATDIFRTCPYLPSHLTLTNYTINIGPAFERVKGDFIFVGKIYDDVDSEGLTFNIFVNFKIRNGDEF